jgi:tyrosyl-tRNA synthetase
MQAKKELARQIVADFYSAEGAAKAGEDWAKQFQKDEVPDSVEELFVPLSNVLAGVEAFSIQAPPIDVQVLRADHLRPSAMAVRVDKLLLAARLAESASDGGRKIKQKAVEIDGERIEKSKLAVVRGPDRPYIVRVGRMKKKIHLT